MKIRVPLYAKILLWFFVNLVVLGAAFGALSHFQFHFGLNSLITGSAGARIDATGELIGAELRHSPRKNWNEILARFSDAYHVNFFLFGYDGSQAAGEPIELPEEVHTKLMELRPPLAPDPHPPEPGIDSPRPGDRAPRDPALRPDGPPNRLG